MSTRVTSDSYHVPKLSHLLSKRKTRWRSHSTCAKHFTIRCAMTNYMSDVTIRMEDITLWSIRYHRAHASLAGRNFSDVVFEVEDGTAILHPAFRDSTWFFSFFWISPSIWTAVELWTEIPIELESRAAMTRRRAPGNKKKLIEKKRQKNIEIKRRLRWHVIIMRSVSSPERSSPLFCERQSYIPRLLARRREGECVVRNKCWKLRGRRIPRGNSKESFRVCSNRSNITKGGT